MALCQVRAHYLAYLRAVVADYQSNVGEALKLLQDAVADFKAGYDGYEQTAEGNELEGSVLSALIVEVDEDLANLCDHLRPLGLAVIDVKLFFSATSFQKNH